MQNLIVNMPLPKFPPVETSDNDTGLLAMGGSLDIDLLLHAYRSGIFPWPVTADHALLWFAPKMRAVLFTKDFHISSSLKKSISNNHYSITIDKDFDGVLRACAESGIRKSQGTWITPTIVTAYNALHKAGYAHSVECYGEEGKLLGGLYGVSIGKMFAGESMFHIETDCSKICLCYLVDYLKERGVEWIDCQQLTPLLQSFGAVEIPQAEFMELLNKAINEPVDLFAEHNEQIRM
ncbi:MAG: leucyl/phenylalanyl-tRNA--protein transferase [Deltaproteobacteria bacterium]|nr:leucyl/phenylalanyl-tRNA--protein transferase [Deltaproteobacteria bacterium]